VIKNPWVTAKDLQAAHVLNEKYNASGATVVTTEETTAKV